MRGAGRWAGLIGGRRAPARAGRNAQADDRSLAVRRVHETSGGRSDRRQAKYRRSQDSPIGDGGVAWRERWRLKDGGRWSHAIRYCHGYTHPLHRHGGDPGSMDPPALLEEDRRRGREEEAVVGRRVGERPVEAVRKAARAAGPRPRSTLAISFRRTPAMLRAVPPFVEGERRRIAR